MAKTKKIEVYGHGWESNNHGDRDVIGNSVVLNSNEKITYHLSSYGYRHHDVFDFDWKKEDFIKVGIKSKEDYEIVGYCRISVDKKQYTFEKLKDDSYKEKILNKIKENIKPEKLKFFETFKEVFNG